MGSPSPEKYRLCVLNTSHRSAGLRNEDVTEQVPGLYLYFLTEEVGVEELGVHLIPHRLIITVIFALVPAFLPGHRLPSSSL